MDDLIEDNENQNAIETFTLPPVQIAVVSHNENEWFQESLASLANQNYPDKRLTVLSTGDLESVRSLVEPYFPEADLLQVNPSQGLGVAFNKVLENSDDPAFYFFCHHDVALAPDAIRLMVEESYRSNASVIGPKIVNWDRPNELLDVGMGMDRLAFPLSRAEIGEIDQEQFDTVDQVFAISNTAFLVRADLFRALEGFDEAMGMFGEDLDFCWRAQIVGGKVMTVPGAVARHREESGEYKTSAKRNKFQERHRIRSILSNSGRLAILPNSLLAFTLSLLKGIFSLMRGRLSDLITFIDSWIWNFLNLKTLFEKRKNIKQLRQVADSEIRSEQAQSSPIKHLFNQSNSAISKSGVDSRLRIYLDELRNGPSRVSIAFLILGTILFLFGSRHLVTRSVPAIGQLVPFDKGPIEIIESWASGYWTVGIGHEGALPNSMGLIGVVGIIFWGFMGLLRTVLTLGLIPIGVAGIWLFLKPFGSPYVKVAGAVIYLVNPLPYHALSTGNWDALVLFATLPWALIMLARAGKSSPFGNTGGQFGANVLSPNLFREIITLGFLLGVIASFSPISVVAVVTVSLLVIVGSFVAGTTIKIGRLILVLSIACLVGLALNLPWIFDLYINNFSLETLLGNRISSAEKVGIVKALTLSPDADGTSILGWGFPIVALMPLLLAKGERWAWAVRGWMLYLSGIGLVWIQNMELIPFSLPRAEVLLIPASLGLAVAGAMGAGALQRDLQTFKFGWRQLVPITAIAAILMAILPFLALTFSGDWGMPDDELNDVLSYEEDNSNRKILFVSNSDLLPATGNEFTENLSVLVSSGFSSTFDSRWQPRERNVDNLLVSALLLARENGTSNLGSLLAQFGITDIVLIERLVPLPSSGPSFQMDQRFKLALSRQLDLAKVEISPGITRYRNLSSVGFAGTAISSSTVGNSLQEYASSTGPSFLESLNAASNDMRAYEGQINSKQEIFIAFPYTNQWKLEINGIEIGSEVAIDWATGFSPQVDGLARISYQTSGQQKTATFLQVTLWLITLIALIRSLSDAKVHQG